MGKHRPSTICVDFDGVIHSYSSGWKGACVIPDPPVPGALEFLRSLIADDRFEPCIYSSRSKEEGAIDAMRAWLLEHGFTTEELLKLRFPTQKPAANMTIDDRAFCFEGTYPTLEWLADFRPWNKR